MVEERRNKRGECGRGGRRGGKKESASRRRTKGRNGVKRESADSPEGEGEK